MLAALAALLAWAVVALPVTVLVLVNSSRTTTVASHEAVVSPTLDGWAHLDLGPLLPSLRYPTDSTFGAEIDLGKTTLGSYEELVQRYAFLAASPEGQIRKVEGAVTEMAVAALAAGTLTGLVGPALWLILGARRRQEIADHPWSSAAAGLSAALAVTLVAALATRPWDQSAQGFGDTAWQPLTEALPDVRIPEEAAPLEVDAGLLTQGTKRLVESALNSYRTSSDFYGEAAEEAATLADELRLPQEGESIALLVSDRHDNIGMDPVARAVGDAAGATFLLNAGDDTSTGSEWEAFSLESLDAAFADYEHRFYVAGNHDNGDFVTEQAAGLGFTTLNGEVVEGPGGIRLLGADDPRSSGLGNWKDEKGLSFSEVEERLADAACAADEDGERVNTILVHDANLGRTALDRGCADLVVGGHLHVVRGPDPTVGPEGQIGHSYTNASTGGAAYAIAIGTKPRRDAVMSLITYREARPVGVQWVSLSPLGDWTVGPWTPLTRTAPDAEPGPRVAEGDEDATAGTDETPGPGATDDTEEDDAEE